VDVSRHKEVRGFDIGGHHYWYRYRHPWMSSDILFLLRTNLPPGFSHSMMLYAIVLLP
jgi:hypothetical protein